MPVGDVVNLNRRRQHTTAQAGHFFDGKQMILIRILLFRDAKFLLEGIINGIRPHHVAGGSHAKLDPVAPGWLKAELGIEG